MEEKILNLLHQMNDKIDHMQEDIKETKADIKTLKQDIRSLDTRVKYLEESYKNTNETIHTIQLDLVDVKRILNSNSKKLDSVQDQTAFLTEFRTVTRDNFEIVNDNVETLTEMFITSWRQSSKLRKLK